MKLDEAIKCPHCGVEEWYVFHDNTPTLECNNCGKFFDIKLETKVVVTATIPRRKCYICNTEFVADNWFEEDNVCPRCGHKGYHYQI